MTNGLAETYGWDRNSTGVRGYLMDTYNMTDAQADSIAKQYVNSGTNNINDFIGEGLSSGKLQTELTGTLVDPNIAANQPQNEDSGWGMKEWGTAGNIGLGVGQLGLGIVSYFDNKKTADAQRKLLNQQYQNNATEIANKKAYRTALSNMRGLS